MNPDYYLLSGAGVCGTGITDIASCSAAASALALPDTTATVASGHLAAGGAWCPRPLAAPRVCVRRGAWGAQGIRGRMAHSAPSPSPAHRDILRLSLGWTRCDSVLVRMLVVLSLYVHARV